MTTTYFTSGTERFSIALIIARTPLLIFFFSKVEEKKIIYRFTGYDVRTRTLDMKVNPYSGFRHGFKEAAPEAFLLREIELIKEYSDLLLVQDPELQQFCPEAEIIPRALDLKKWQFISPNEETKNRPLIVHAPSNSIWKGSKFVWKAIQDLRERNLPFDFKLIENMHQDEARLWYQRADIIIDGMLVGTTGVSTLEGWALGKAVVNNTREDLFAPFYNVNELPVVNANPDNLAQKLEILIKDFDMRVELGRRGRQIVERYHDIRTVVKKFARMYDRVHKKPSKPISGYADINYLNHQTKLIAQLERRYSRTGDKLRSFEEDHSALNDEIRKVKIRNNYLERQLTKNARTSNIPVLSYRFFTKHRSVSHTMNYFLWRTFVEYRGDGKVRNRAKRILAPIYVCKKFGRNVSISSERDGYIFVQFHDVFSIPTIHKMNKRKLICGPVALDLVETSDLSHRSGPAIRNMDPVAKGYFHYITGKAIRSSDALFTVSDELKRYFWEKHKADAVVVRNCRPNQVGKFAGRVPDLAIPKVGFGSHLVNVVYANTVAPDYGVEHILDAFKHLGGNYHLHIVGKFMNDKFESEFWRMVDSKNIRKQVHFHGIYAGEKMIDVLKLFDVGLNILDPSLENLKFALPNRIFDYIAAEIPVITTNIPSVADIVEKYGNGTVISDYSEDAIVRALKNFNWIGHNNSSRLRTASRELSWEHEKDVYVSAISQLVDRRGLEINTNARAAIVARKAIDLNNRIARQTEALCSLGFGVDIFAYSEFDEDIFRPSELDVKVHVMPR